MLPVTAGRAVALATVPTMMFCLSPLSRALADDYFDPAALEFADPQQQTSDLHYFAKPGGQQPGTYPVTVVVNDRELGQADITFVDDSPIPRCHICCAKDAANSVSAPAATTPGESVRSPEFLQGTLFYGLTAGFTLYGGTQLARDYQAWALGPGRGFGEFGSLGGDVTRAVTRTPSGKRYTGHSLRAQYQKILSARALRSASPAIATRQAAITILPKPAPLKAPGGK